MDSSSTNPEPPVGQRASKPLTNDDFRTLIMTPRASGSFSTPAPPSESSSFKRNLRHSDIPSRDKDRIKKKFRPSKDKATSLKEEEERIESLKKYRDRAKERRDGQVKDFELDPDDLKLTNPTLHCEVEDNRVISEDERRQQQIEESKFLGGDVKHTHLVKGLDFALLQKVKTELKTVGKDASESEDESEDEAILEAMKSAHLIPNTKKVPEEDKCRTRLAQSIIDVLNEKFPEKNHLFHSGRMSYIMPIDLDSYETPITIIRSKADTSTNEDSATNDIIINKLIQMVSKIRQVKVSKRKKPKELEAS